MKNSKDEELIYCGVCKKYRTIAYIDTFGAMDGYNICKWCRSEMLSILKDEVLK